MRLYVVERLEMLGNSGVSFLESGKQVDYAWTDPRVPQACEIAVTHENGRV